MLSWRGKGQSHLWLTAFVVLGLIIIGLTTDSWRPSRRAERDAAGVALMPEVFIEPRVRQLELGQAGWVTSWSVTVDQKRGCWLDGEAVVFPRRYGTANIFIKRELDGFHARCYAKDYRWEVESEALLSRDRVFPVRSFVYKN